MPMRVAVCASGGGSNLGALLGALRGSELAQVVLVLSNNPAAGALARAREARVPAEVLDDYRNAEEWIYRLDSRQVDLVVLAGYLKLVPREVIARYRGRIINIHPSLLPKFGGPGMYGRFVHQAVLAAGEKISGATVHLVDEEYDRGRVLDQDHVTIARNDTAEQLAAKVLKVEHRLLPRVVLRLAKAHQESQQPSTPRRVRK
ncbi:MAG TPA: phosphoribosylglycinamide formyltransferase [Gemmatimonadales bacterium]|nr:phosphoribosylglycinamide formyltransferase [Gemmatimonadales bacterium]